MCEMRAEMVIDLPAEITIGISQRERMPFRAGYIALGNIRITWSIGTESYHRSSYRAVDSIAMVISVARHPYLIDSGRKIESDVAVL